MTGGKRRSPVAGASRRRDGDVTALFRKPTTTSLPECDCGVNGDEWLRDIEGMDPLDAKLLASARRHIERIQREAAR